MAAIPSPDGRAGQSVARIATIGLFLLALIGALHVARPLVMPIVAAILVGITLAPLVNLGHRVRMPRPVSAVLIVGLVTVVLIALATLLATSLADWLARSPEIGTVISEKLRILDAPLAALRGLRDAITNVMGSRPGVTLERDAADMLGAVVATLTPAVAQLVLFVTFLLFFLVSSSEMRQRFVVAFVGREARLEALRIWNDVERHLIGYVATVTAINAAVGLATSAMLVALDFPNPLAFGLLAFVLNYIPYLGPGIVALALGGVGLVSFSSLGVALLPAALFVVMATIEGHLVTPGIVGRRLTLNPLVALAALAFWLWLWGPFGAFLAVPLLIVVLVAADHLLPAQEPSLPG